MVALKGNTKSKKETRFRYERMLRRSRSLTRLAISFAIEAKLADSADSRKKLPGNWEIAMNQKLVSP